MILEKLMEIEKDALSKINLEQQRLKTAEKFRKMLFDIDFTYELVRMNDAQKLSDLMKSLKKDELNESETRMINELTK